jgi:hypothetical protein
MSLQIPRPPSPSQASHDRHAYIPQNVMSPPTVTPNFASPDHFQPSVEQPPVEQQATQLTPQVTSPQPEHVSTEQAFDFIMKPEQAVAKRQLPGGSSMAIRLALVFGGLLILIVIFAVLKSLLGGSSNLSSFVTVAQDQQELIHLVGNAITNSQTPLSTNDQNFTATAQLSLASAQAGLTTYLKTNGMKAISPKVLNLKVSATTDSQITAAITADTYGPTFQQIMKNQLAQYETDLNGAYQKTTGTHGRALLKSDFQQAQLLQTQLSAGG